MVEEMLLESVMGILLVVVVVMVAEVEVVEVMSVVVETVYMVKVVMMVVVVIRATRGMLVTMVIYSCATILSLTLKAVSRLGSKTWLVNRCECTSHRSLTPQVCMSPTISISVSLSSICQAML